MERRFFFAFFLFFLIGAFISNILQEAFLSLLLFFVLLLFLSQLVYYNFLRKDVYLFLIIFIWYFFGVVLSTFAFFHISHNFEKILPYTFWKHVLISEIEDVYSKDAFSTQYRAKILSISGDNIDTNMYTLLRIPNNFTLQKGFVIETVTQLKIIDNFDNFDYQKFLLSKGIYTQGFVNVLQVQEDVENVFTHIEQLRQYALEILWKLYTEEERIFLWGILFGAREDIPKELETHFNNSGLTHLIAVSGFNISILIVFLSFFVSKLPGFLRLSCIILGITFFVVFVWFWAPVVRAGIMGILWYLSLHFGRNSNTIALVLVTAFLMILYSPLSLNYDISFQLSFLAVLGIYYTQWFFQRIFFFVPKLFAIQEALVLTMSALILTVPIMLFQFGQISLLAPIANIAVTWTIPLAMLWGFLSFLFYLFVPMIWYMFGFFTWILLKYDILMVHIFGSFEPWVLQFNFWEYWPYLQTLYFMVLIFLILTFSHKKEA